MSIHFVDTRRPFVAPWRSEHSPTAGGRNHDPQPRKLERPLQEGRPAAAARRLLELPLLGRGQDASTSSAAKGARLWDIDGNEYIDYRLAYGPCILGYADPRVDEAARARHRHRRRVRVRHRARVRGRRAHRAHGARGRAGALLQLGHRGRDGRAARRARLHRQGRLRRVEGGYHGVFDAALWYTRDRGLEAGPRATRRSCPTATASRACCARCARRADERRRPPREHVQGHGDRHRRVPDRADHGQLLLDLGDARVPARRARAVRPVRRGA